jgi:hypothetical protein
LLFSPISNKEISGGNGQNVHHDMEELIINQNDETVWYENDRLIQQYLNRSRKTENKKEDSHVNNSSRLKIINKSKGKS